MMLLPIIGRAPVLILWNYGYWCNMDCLHCYSRREARMSVRDMSGEEADFLAGKFIEAGVMQVHFGGGEPLGRDDMLPIATRLKRSGIRVTLSTNGWFLTEAIADAISSVPFSMVAFSIHGSDAASHDAFTRCEGAWNRLVEAVGRLVDRGISTKLVMTLMRPTASHAVKLLELAKQ
jgi:MoaA/NifB/PqqE/SkfB family radical SAM enzyme